MSSKLRLILSLLLLAALTLAPIPAAAQGEEEPEGPTYIVQPGDTLSSIALRFNISQQDIIAASGISNPDALDVGDVLVLPGLDWIDGTLLFEDLPLGETYTSIKRRYLLTDDDMARLNRLTSPNQLYYGFSTLLATERGELADAARAAIGPGGTLLEAAVASGDNPWSLVAYNQLAAPWAAMAGDVLFTPATTDPGPGAVPSPISAISLKEDDFVQGHVAVIRVNTDGPVDLSGQLLDHTLRFFQDGEGSYVTLQGIAVETDPGTYTVNLSGTLPDGGIFALAEPVRVISGNFATATLTVPEELLDAQLSADESDYVASIMSEATPDKLWSGQWGWPHDLVNDVTSEFGLFRTYNGGISQSYHYGVDFGGGALLNIYAPAAGRVVFSGPLDVRGNATIIDHGWGVYTGYWHQMESYVSEGDMVEPGQVIGIVGKTGRVSGPHLHWEVWANGVPVEPLDWLDATYP